MRQAKITLGFNASTDLNEMSEETIHKHFMAKLQLVSVLAISLKDKRIDE